MADYDDNKDIVEDTDADTQDVDDDAKTDEEQVVEDTDADTSDIDAKIDKLMSAIDALSTLVSDKFDAYGKMLIGSGATVTETETVVEPAEEETSEGEETLEDLDYTI